MRNYKYDPYRDRFIRIDDEPVIDAEPIVRCSNCVYFVNTHLKKDGITNDHRYKPDFCEYHGEDMEEDDFCSKGVRS